MKKYTVQKAKAGDVKLLILRPTTAAKPREKTPGILWIHGGGYTVGMANMVYMSRAMDLVKKYGAVVVTPEYRLAGKAPYPAALEDCYEAILYLKSHARELGCNADQIMVGGESAGGGLTAALCMYARDRGEVNIAFHMPLYPMIDDRDTESSRNNRGISWNTKRNHAAWKLYLSKVIGEPPPYAAPARQTDFTGMPPAYTFVGDSETFYCETLAYIENLKKAGVPACVNVYKTGFHAFDILLPFRRISKEARAAFVKQYLYAQEHYFAQQNRNADHEG